MRSYVKKVNSKSDQSADDRPSSTKPFAPDPSRRTELLSPRHIGIQFRNVKTPQTAQSDAQHAKTRDTFQGSKRVFTAPALTNVEQHWKAEEDIGGDFLSGFESIDIPTTDMNTTDMNYPELPQHVASLSARLHLSITGSKRPPTATKPRSGPAQVTSTSHSSRKDTFSGGGSQSVVSATSTKFSVMSVDELIEYFTEAAKSEGTTTKTSFLHVTPRFNIEKVSKDNFYDLVLLERPGDPKSGKVWIQGSMNKTHTLKPHQLMQLSLHGLLLTEHPDDGGNGVFISLSDFMFERTLVKTLQMKRFFRTFKECRCFAGWRRWVRSVRMARTSKMLLERTFFTHEPLLAALRMIKSYLYDMEIEVELFAFHGCGAICITDFLAIQMQRLTTIKIELDAKINKLGGLVAEYYEVITGDDYLSKEVEEVKKHHPYSHAETAGVTVDWVELRSLQRLRDDCRSRLGNILWMAQYRLDITIALILEKFWQRFIQFLKGVRHVRQVNYKGYMGYWTLAQAAEQEMDPPPVIVETSIHSANIDVGHNRGNAFLRAMLGHSDPIPGSGDNPLHVSFTAPTAWIQEGSHLGVNVTMCIRNELAPIDAFLNPDNSTKLKVTLLPLKKNLVQQVHGLLGSIASLFDSLPSLRSHPLVEEGRYEPPDVTATGEEVNDMAETSSSRYFSMMNLFPIRNSAGGLQYAVLFLHSLHEAHNHAINVQSRVVRMEDAFKKLSALNPDNLIKQLNRSLLVPKIKELMNSPDTVDDVGRSISRERLRLDALERAIEFLGSSKMKDVFSDVKHESGMITCFGAANKQLDSFADIQYLRLFSKLPGTFSTRCKTFTEYILALRRDFELTQTDLDGLIDLMKKLKNFEVARELFQFEVRMCSTLFELIEQHGGASSKTVSAELAHLKNMSGVRGRQVVTTSPPVLMKQFQDAKDRLFATISTGRNLLLGQLAQIKHDSLSYRQGIHVRINREREMLLKPLFISRTINPVDILTSMRSCGDRISEIQKNVADMMGTQQVLLEAHDIIGAANIVLSPSEVDHFSDMDELQQLCSNRLKFWQAIVDAGSMMQSIKASRLANCDIRKLNDQLDLIIHWHDTLNGTSESESTMKMLTDIIADLKPKVEVVSYLSTKCLRARHWRWLGDHVMGHCKYILRYSGAKSELVSVVDMAGKDPITMGNVSRLYVADLFSRDIEAFISLIRSITTEAAIEAMIESTMEQVYETIKAITVVLSSDWLRDSALREKMFFELNRATNLTQLRVVIQYCQKTTLVLEQTSIDMNLMAFTEPLDKLRETIQRLDRFIENLREIQYKWMYVFHYVKFAVQGELDRDAARTYQVCSDEIKRIELAIQQKSCNLFSACNSLVDTESGMENTKSNLTSIMEDAHSNVQSMLDACPRLSWISYTDLSSLSKAWIVGAHRHLDIVNDCMHFMFEGVGSLRVAVNLAQRLHYCTGFTSHEMSEIVVFGDPVVLQQPLVDFIRAFEQQLRLAISSAVDNQVLERIQMMRSLVGGISIHDFVLNMQSILSQRLSLLIATVNDDHPNQSFVLLNYSSFAEDLWVCLGQPTGSIVFAKPNIADATDSLVRGWRDSLKLMQAVCSDNIQTLQRIIQLLGKGLNLQPRKARDLAASLFLQEVNFLRLAEELLACKCRESATELWAAKYQLRFLYNKAERFRDSPFDVTVGCTTVPYGMEYHGGYVKVIPDAALEMALQKVLSSAVSLRATVFISHDESYFVHEAVGEYSVCCQDIAHALGRVCTTLVSVQNVSNVRLFLGRLAYMDAVGCIDFTNVDHMSVQIIIQALNSFWRAFEEKNDVFVQDSLKFPLKTRHGNTDLQTIRRKENLVEFRAKLDTLSKARKFAGLMVVGLASENSFVDVSVFEYFCGSIFNVVSVEHNQPINELGLLLSADGFVYGMEIQTLLESTLTTMKLKFKNSLNILNEICSSRLLHHVAMQAGHALRCCLRLETLSAAALAARLGDEFECFLALLWEDVLMLGNDFGGATAKELRSTLLEKFQMKIDDTVTDAQTKVVLLKSIDNNHLLVARSVQQVIYSVATECGLLATAAMTEHCAALWKNLTGDDNSLIILCGDSAVGKTSIREVVVEIVQSQGKYPSESHKGVSSLILWRAGKVILTKMRLWLAQVRAKKAKAFLKQQIQQLHGGGQGGHRKGPVEAESSGIISDPAATPARHHGGKKKGNKHGRHVHVSHIFVASLSSSAFLGHYDTQGRWCDGMLLRKMRAIKLMEVLHQDKIRAQATGHGTSHNGHGNSNSHGHGHASESTLHLIVLDGPMGYYMEQVFGAEAMLASKTSLLGKVKSHNTLVLPSGEVFSVPPNLKFLIETSDVSNASPAVLVRTLQTYVKQNNKECVEKLLKVWMRSITNWLGNFPPWTDALQELSQLLLHTNFVDEFLYHDQSIDQIKQCVVVAKITAFLRYLEALLRRCHDLAVADAHFIKPEYDESETLTQISNDEDDDDDSDSSDGSEGDSHSRASGESGSSSSTGPSRGSDKTDVRAASGKEGNAQDDDEASATRGRRGGGGHRKDVGDAKDARKAKTGEKGMKEKRKLSNRKASDSKGIEAEEQRAAEKILNRNMEEVKFEHLVMTLGDKGRERLRQRLHLSLTYAVIWGFGGSSNASPRGRKFFDTMVKDTMYNLYSGEVVFPDALVFELVVNMQTCEFEEAIEPSFKNIENFSGSVPKKFETVRIGAELLKFQDADFDFRGMTDRLMFRSPTIRALHEASVMLLGSGANLLIMGPKGSGKTSVLLEILAKLRENTSTPQQMKDYFYDNLIDVIGERTEPQGIAAALAMMCSTLKQFHRTPQEHDEQTTFSKHWLAIQDRLKSLSAGGARSNCAAKTVFSTSTSLRGTHTADELRFFFEREFCTEVKNVLETPRYNHGIVFVDDLHFTGSMPESDRRLIENRPEALLKGILSASTSFAVKKNLTFRLPNSPYSGRADGHMELEDRGKRPVLHRATTNDPRVLLDTQDDFIMQRLSIVSAATGNLRDLSQSDTFTEGLQHYALMSLPEMGIHELHTGLIRGSFVCLSAGSNSHEIVSTLKSEIIELVQITIHLCSKMVSSADSLTTTDLEKSIRSLVTLDVNLIERFCTSLRLGASNVSNPGGLIQLYAHEWKRYFLDPVPNGPQRDRYFAILKSELEAVDIRRWFVSAEWMDEVLKDLQASTDRVWANPSAFTSLSARGEADILLHSDVKYSSSRSVSAAPPGSRPQSAVATSVADAQPTAQAMSSSGGNDRIASSSGKVESSGGVMSTVAAAEKAENFMNTYLPIEMDRERATAALNEDFIAAPLASSGDDITVSDSTISDAPLTRKVTISDCFGDRHVSSILYPAGVSMVLRLSRVLASVENHLLLVGYLGTAKVIALNLAAKICNLSFCCYDCKDAVNSLETLPSNRASASFNFHRFLKSVIFRVAGFRNVKGDVEEVVFNPFYQINTVGYNSVEPESVLAVIAHAQQLSAQERRALLNIIDYNDPMVIFDTAEVIGMADALRVAAAAEAEIVKAKLSEKKEQSKLFLGASEAVAEPVAAPAGGIIEAIGTAATAVPGGGRGAPEGKLDGAIDDSAYQLTLAQQVKGRNLLTGYSLQWVKRHLQACINARLQFVLDTDISRAMKLKPSAASKEPKADTGEGMSEDGDVASGAANDTLGAGTEATTATAAATHSHAASKKRYSMLVNSNTNQVIAASSGRSVGTTGALNVDGILDCSREALGVFDCPLLSPMLGRRFNAIWWDIDGCEATSGMSNLIIKNYSRKIRRFGVDCVPRGPVSSSYTVALALKASAIGEYHDYNEPDGPAERSSVPVVGADTRGVDKAVVSKQVGRRNKNRAAILGRFKLLIELEHRTALVQFLGLVDKMGVFSYCRPAAVHMKMGLHPLSQEDYLVAMLEEAQSVLPLVMTAAAPCDALLLCEPTISMGPERTTEISSEIVCALLREGAVTLFSRRCMLETVASGLVEAKTVLLSIAECRQQLRDHNTEISATSKNLFKHYEHVKLEIDNVHHVFQKSAPAEQATLMYEEACSRYAQIMRDEREADDALQRHRRKLYGVSQVEWYALAAIYAARPGREYVDVMRCIMIIINFVPSKAQRGKNVAPGEKLDDDAVARCSISILRSHDFVSNLANAQPSSISHKNLTSLHVLNKLMHGYAGEYIYEAPPLLDTATDGSVSNPILETLKRYAFMVEVFCNVNSKTKGRREEVKLLNKERMRLEGDNRLAFNTHNKTLQDQSEQIARNLQELDAELVRNRNKIDVLNRVDDQRADLVCAVDDCLDKIQAEMELIDATLRTIVSDSCVAAAVLARAGWLPDQVRCECMEVFRQCLSKQGLKVSDTPFVLGALTDRTQVRYWTRANTGSLPRDLSSVNALQLLSLSPNHTFVVDPEAVAETAVMEAIPEGFTLCLASALKFSLAQVESWLATAREAHAQMPADSTAGNTSAMSPALYVVVTDVQAGASDDLIAFLSSELCVKEFVHPLSLSLDTPTSYTHELLAYLNPYDDSHNTDGKDREGGFIHLSRFRMVLLSTRSPVMDNQGCCRPLPASCFKNMTVLHWTTSIQTTFYVDSKPMTSPLGKGFTADQALTQAMTELLCHRTSSDHFFNLQEVNSHIMRLGRDIQAIDDRDIVTIYKWMVEDRQDTLQEFSIPGVLTHPAMPLGFLAVEKISKMLLSGLEGEVEIHVAEDSIRFGEANSSGNSRRGVEKLGLGSRVLANYRGWGKWYPGKIIRVCGVGKFDVEYDDGKLRHQLVFDTNCYLSIERELLAYQHSLSQVFTMAVDFLKMCGVIIPAQLFPPHALTPRSLCAKCIHSAITQNQALFSGIPQSLQAAKRISQLVMKLQRNYRVGVTGAAPPQQQQQQQQSGYGDTAGGNTLGGARAAEDASGPRVAAAFTPGSKGQSSHEQAPKRGGVSRAKSMRTAPQPQVMKRMGMSAAEREKYAAELQYMLQPLRTYFLKQLVSHLQTVIRPGQEWMVKFSLVVTIWSKSSESASTSSSVFPMEELRGLAQLFRMSLGQPLSRYAHYVPFDRTFETAAHSSTTSGYAGHRIEPHHAAAGGGEEEEAFSVSLPGAASIARRQTAFRALVGHSGHNPVSTAKLLSGRAGATEVSRGGGIGHDNIAGDDSFDDDDDDDESVGNAADDSSPSKKKGKLTKKQKSLKRKLKLMHRLQSRSVHCHGSGPVAGLLLNRNSPRWRVQYSSTHGGGVPSGTAGPRHSGVVRAGEKDEPERDTLLDELQRVDMLNADFHSREDTSNEIVSKNAIIRPPVRSGDAFEVEWLQASQVSVFAPSSMQAAVALGASAEVLKSIGSAISARKAGNRSTFMAKPQFKAGSGSAAKSVSSGLPRVAGGVSGAVKLGRRLSGAVVAQQKDQHQPHATGRRASRLQDMSKTSGLVGSGSTPSNPLAVVAVSPRQNRLSVRIAPVSGGGGGGNGGVNSSTVAVVATPPQSIVPPVKNPGSKINNMLQGLGSHMSTMRQSIVHLPVSKESTGGGTKSSKIATGGVAGRDKAEIMQKRLSSLLSSPRALYNFYLLSNHAAFARTFKGAAGGVADKIDDFLEWKEVMAEISALEFINMSDEDLDEAARKMIPPNFREEGEEDDGDQLHGSDEGLWMQGYELTIVQSMLLCEAVRPGSAASVANLLFGMISAFIAKGGTMMVHKDEVMEEEDKDTRENDPSAMFKIKEDEEEDDEDDDNEDNHDKTVGVGAVSAASTSLQKAEKREYGDDGDEDDKDEDDEDDDRSEAVELMGRLQDDALPTNSWGRLRAAIKSTEPLPQPRLKSESKAPSGLLRCRDFENWELALLEVLTQDQGVEKYTFMQSLRDSLRGRRSSVFLTSSSVGTRQVSLLSQRARDIGIYNDDNYMAIINRNAMMAVQALTGSATAGSSSAGLGSGEARLAMKQQAVDIVKTIRSASQASRTKKAVIEYLDISSKIGNSILSSGLYPSHFTGQTTLQGVGAIVAALNAPLHSASGGATAGSNHTTAGASSKDTFSTKSSLGSNSGAATGGAGTSSTASGTIGQKLLTSETLLTLEKESRLKLAAATIQSGFTMTAVRARKNSQLIIPPDNPFPYIVTAEWGTAVQGHSPIIGVHDLQYTWLPRFFCPDIVGTGDHTTQPYTRSSENTPPDVRESGAILTEELESCLLWIMITTRRFARADITPKLINRLRHATKVQVRATSCLLAMWNLVNYQRSADNEIQGRPAVWSACLQQITLWQAARLICKVNDILEAPWHSLLAAAAASTRGIRVSDVMANEEFSKGICLVAESFYAFAYDAAPTRLVHEDVPDSRPISKPVRPSTGGEEKVQGRPGVGQLSRETMRSQTARLHVNRRHIQKAAKKATMALRERVDALRSVTRFSRSVAVQMAMDRKDAVVSASQTEAGVLATAAATSATGGNKVTVSAQPVVKESSADIIAAGRLFRDRFLAFLAMYLAELVVHHCKSPPMASAVEKVVDRKMAHVSTAGGYLSLGAAGAAAPTQSNQNATNKADIKSIIDDSVGVLVTGVPGGTARGIGGGATAAVAPPTEFITWPDIFPDNCDITLGGFSAADIVQYLLRWTLDNAGVDAYVQTNTDEARSHPTNFAGGKVDMKKGVRNSLPMKRSIAELMRLMRTLLMEEARRRLGKLSTLASEVAHNMKVSALKPSQPSRP